MPVGESAFMSYGGELSPEEQIRALKELGRWFILNLMRVTIAAKSSPGFIFRIIDVIERIKEIGERGQQELQELVRIVRERSKALPDPDGATDPEEVVRYLNKLSGEADLGALVLSREEADYLARVFVWAVPVVEAELEEWKVVCQRDAHHGLETGDRAEFERWAGIFAALLREGEAKDARCFLLITAMKLVLPNAGEQVMPACQRVLDAIEGYCRAVEGILFSFEVKRSQIPYEPEDAKLHY